MKQIETIHFQGINYPSAIVSMPFGERKISVESLNENLISKDGRFVSENARLIDEGIFYFVSEENITLAHDNLVNLILSEI
jgi:hypothetical protein